MESFRPTSAILHYRFEWIHPFADGNGRTGRALALWELYRRGFDSHHIFSVDEYYWEDRPADYEALDAVRRAGEDLTGWLEYCAEGWRQTLERAWTRVQSFSAPAMGKLVMRPLLKAGLVEKIGTRKSGRYTLRQTS